ncbi:hypothetical protein Agub_g13233, partial [Astrephomene gubernaculifera]
MRQRQTRLARMAPRPSGPKKFSELDCLSPETVNVLTSLGFHTTTPVQEATIPLFCGHKDVAVDACTGSGKTLAFVLPVVERLRRLEEPLKPHQIGAIIISPTRELAKQIHGVAEPFIASVPHLKAMLLVGGTDPAQDVAAFKAHGGHVLVGTPGRIEDILKRCPAMDLRRLEVLVLDEADRLLDMGFKAQLDAVMGRLPKQRRTGLFSATQTEAVQELARAGLRNPVRVNVAVAAVAQQQQQQGKEKGGKEGKQKGAEKKAAADEEGEEDAGAEVAQQKTPNSLSIQYVLCEPDEKIPQLVRFLALHGPHRKVIVYALTCAAVDHLALVLPRLPHMRGVRLRALHGRMKQAARERELEAFRNLPAGALLCTDLAARGLDIPDVHWIVQLDPPQDPAAFVHRVGRTARMGRAGSALVLLTPAEEPYVEFLRLRKVPLTEGAQLPPSVLTPPAATAAAAASAGSADGCSDPASEPAAGKAGKGGGKEGSKAANSSQGNHNHHNNSGAVVSTATPEVLAALRAAAERDREVMERATKAFVTYVRGYKEHHCKFIFRLQDLNIGRLATGLGLLRLPKMPDLKKPLGLDCFTPSAVDPASVPYKDKAREKQRQKALQQRQADAAARGVSSAAAAPAAKRKAAPEQPEARLPAAKRRQLQQIDEAAGLNMEYSLLKKLKRGKISQHQYEVAMGLASDSEGEEQQQQQGAEVGQKKEKEEKDGGNKATGQRAQDSDEDEDSAGPAAGSDGSEGEEEE